MCATIYGVFLLQDEEISSGESSSEQNKRLPTPQLRKLVTASDLEVWVTLRMGGKYDLVSCPPRVHLPARNGLVNEVEFLGLIPQNGGRPMRLRDR